MILQECFKKLGCDDLTLGTGSAMSIWPYFSRMSWIYHPRISKHTGYQCAISALHNVLISTIPDLSHTHLTKFSIKQMNSTWKNKHILDRPVIFLNQFLFPIEASSPKYYFWKHFAMEDSTWVLFPTITIILVNNNDLQSSVRRHC